MFTIQLPIPARIMHFMEPAVFAGISFVRKTMIRIRIVIVTEKEKIRRTTTRTDVTTTAATLDHCKGAEEETSSVGSPNEREKRDGVL